MTQLELPSDSCCQSSHTTRGFSTQEDPLSKSVIREPLTNVDGEDFEESIPSVTVTSRCSATMFFQPRKRPSNPTSVPESLHTSLASQARETLPRCSFVLDETLILIGTVVNVVWCKEDSSTQLAAFSQEDPLSICCPGLCGEIEAIPMTVLYGMSTKHVTAPLSKLSEVQQTSAKSTRP